MIPDVCLTVIGINLLLKNVQEGAHVWSCSEHFVFLPMFADLPVGVQLDIFRLLDCHSRLNLSLTCTAWCRHRLRLLQELQPELFLLQTALGHMRGSHREGAICKRPFVEIRHEDGRLIRICTLDDTGDTIAVRRSHLFGYTILSVYHPGTHNQLMAHPDLQQDVMVDKVQVVGRSRPTKDVLPLCDWVIEKIALATGI